MLEDLCKQVESRYHRYSDERSAEKKRLDKKYKVDESRGKISELEGLVEKELEAFDQKREKEKRAILKDIALAVAEIWGCETAEAGKEVVTKFLKMDFPGSQ